MIGIDLSRGKIAFHHGIDGALYVLATNAQSAGYVWYAERAILHNTANHLHHSVADWLRA